MMNNIKCPYQSLCGSCQLLNDTYQNTLKFKLKYVNESLQKNGIKKSVSTIIPANPNYNYRNKMIIAYKYQNGKIISGFYEENSHHIVNIEECLMNTPLQNQIAKGIKKIFQDLKIKPYDEDKKTGLIRYVLLREAIYTNEVLVVIVTASEIFPGRGEVVKRIRGLSNKIKSIVQNINQRKTSIVLGDKERLLYGKGYITDIFDNLKFNITSKAFYQINTIQTKHLYHEVKRLAAFKGSECIVDAYSGLGTIGLFLASKVKEVYSVENNKQAVNMAIVNAKINNIKNINFVCDDATNYLVNLSLTKTKVDTVIMDPPRSGSTIAFLNAIKQIKPSKVIYVSCDPETLARDLKYLKENYMIENIECVDMFCWTKHIETIVLLKKITKN